MKKIISLLLSMMLLFSCSAAFAQEPTVVDISGRFQIKGVLPDGYQLSILSQDSLSLEGEIKSADPDAPVMHLYVAYDETKSGIRTLNDLPGSELENIRQSFLEEYIVDFSELTTASGIPLLVVKEVQDAPDFLDFYTVFLGHEIELWLNRQDSTADPSLPEEQLAAWTEFVKALEFVSLQ